MQTKPGSLMKHPAFVLLFCTLALFLAILLSVFLHEAGHGLGARLEGVHISTGFNQVGDYGKSPDDPDFRSAASQASVLSGLLGPMLSWGLAILFTIWLSRFENPSWGAMAVGAMAVANGLARALPTLTALFSNLAGLPRLEDEVTWGIWIVVKYCRPLSVPPSMDFHALLSNFPGVFYHEAVFWLAPLISLAISLACLIGAYRNIVRLWRDELRPVEMRLFSLMPVIVYFAFKPLQDILDRLIRINW